MRGWQSERLRARCVCCIPHVTFVSLFPLVSHLTSSHALKDKNHGSSSCKKAVTAAVGYVAGFVRRNPEEKGKKRTPEP